MNYTAARTQIRTGDLLFWSGGSWKNLHDIQVLAVRVFDTTEYSHVGFAWVVLGRVFVIHAIGRGVSIDPLSTQGSFYWIPMGIDYPDAALEQGFARVGEKYSKWDAILGFFKRLKIGENTAWQCAEFVIWLWQLAGVHMSDTATPSAIVADALAHGYSLQRVEQ